MRSLAFSFQSLLGVLCVALVAGCDWRANQAPSILVVAVESLSAEAFFCGHNDPEFTDGFGVLCADGVRFTHAFAPSTMSQATLASMLTGLYPKDTGVWHNGAQYLSEKFETAAEKAFQAGYGTSFFSGGPPIWRKSGLEQGFELFEDNLSVSLNEIYRPVQKTFDLFLNWLEDRDDTRPFFTFIYLPDLQFPNVVTTDDFGQARARNVDGQVREVSESFAHLVARLKQMGLWNNTYVIVTGLNGQSLPARMNELTSTNLQSENTQVLLIAKPARKARDIGLEWSVDTNVSLVDIGATLFDILGVESAQAPSGVFSDVASLKASLLSAQVDWDRDRYIVSESAWASWRDVGDTRFAIRQQHWLYVFDQNPQLFNMLTDRFESQPISSSDSSARAVANEMRRFLVARGMAPWGGLTPALVEKINLYRELVNPSRTGNEVKSRLAHIIRKRAWDKQLVGWMARIALQQEDWALLEQLGVEHFYPTWVYLAKRRQNRELPMPADPCWEWVNKKVAVKRGVSTCQDSEFMAFGEWVRADSSKRSPFEEKFLRLYSYAELDERIASDNFLNSLMWDTDMSIPAEPRMVDLALALSEFKSFRQIVNARIKKP